MKNFAITYILLFSVSWCSLAQNGIPDVYELGDVERLIREHLLGSEYMILENIQIQGDTLQYGYYENLHASIGYSEGMILSTGSVHDARGPNSASNTTTDFPLGNLRPRDYDLEAISNSSSNEVFDQIILEFDFIPLTDSIAFEFIFASEEYCDYVGELKNDAFGFFLSGPGISGPFENQAVNLARIPGSNDYVTINSINHRSNTAFFRDNTPMAQPQFPMFGISNCQIPASGGSVLDDEGFASAWLEYDGMTQVLTAKSSVLPGEEYHLKIALCDIGDGSYDSAVLFKKKSFRSGEFDVKIRTPDTLDCKNDAVNLAAESVSAFDLQYEWISLDGHQISNPYSDEIEVRFPGLYQVISSSSRVNCNDTSEVEVHAVADYLQILDWLPDAITCTRDEVIISPPVISPQSGWQAILDYPSGLRQTSDTSIFMTNEIGSHRLILRQLDSSCQVEQYYDIKEDRASISATLGEPLSNLNCKDTIVMIQPIYTGDTSFQVFWSGTGDGLLSSPDAVYAEVTESGAYEVHLTHDRTGCVDSFSFNITQDQRISNFEIQPLALVDCAEQEINLSIQNLQDYDAIVNWSTDSGKIIGVDSGLEIRIQGIGNYSVASEHPISGCRIEKSVSVLKDPEIEPLVIISDGSLTCTNETSNLNVNYPLAFSNYYWNTENGNIVKIQNQSALIDQAGMYSIKAFIARSGCVIGDSIEVEDLRFKPDISINYDGRLDCNNEMLATLDLDRGIQNYAVFWDGSLAPLPIDSHSYQFSMPGSYTVRVVHLQTGCEATQEIFVESTPRIVLEGEFVVSQCHLEQPAYLIQRIILDSLPLSEAEVIYHSVSYQPGDTIPMDKNDRYLTIKWYEDCHQDTMIEIPEILPLQAYIQGPDQVSFGRNYGLELHINRADEELASLQWESLETMSCDDCKYPIISFAEFPQANVLFTDIYGCSLSLNWEAELLRDIVIYSPSAFSPNSDGLNDVYRVYPNDQIIGLTSMQIYSRWGGSVFELEYTEAQDAALFVWNGRVQNQPAPVGSYVLKLRAIFVDGSEHLITKTFQLIR